MVTLVDIEQTITVIEANQDTLGEQTVSMTLSALHEQMIVLTQRRAPAPRLAERKQVTVLFAKISGLANLATASPDPNILDLLNQLWERLDQVITKYDGHLDKHIAAGLMGVFGVPISREDDAERAIHAALALQIELREFVAETARQATLGAELFRDTLVESQIIADLQHLRVQIGINSGLVLLSEVGVDAEYTVLGDVVNVASRLQSVAADDEIVISQETQRLVRGFIDVEKMAPIAIKGKAEMESVYRVLGFTPRSASFTGRGVPGVQTRLIGRKKELRQLQSLWHEVVGNGRSQFVFLLGEAGLGKTRLARELAQMIETETGDFRLLQARAEQRLRQLPNVLLQSLFSTTFNIQDNDSLPTALHKLREGMTALLPAHHGHYLRWQQAALRLLGFDLDEPFVDVGMAGEQTQERLQEDMTDFWIAVSQQSPATLLLLEDLHWADEGSLNWLKSLLKRAHDAPLLIVGISRPTLFEQFSDWQEATAVAKTIQLKPLTVTAGRQLVREILQYLPEVPTPLCDLVIDTASGNPYHVEELINMLIEDGVIVPEEEKWRLVGQQLPQMRIPATLTGVIQARLDRLSYIERTVLQRAAVVGRQFWDSALKAINATTTHPFADDAISSALQVMEARDLIYRLPTTYLQGQQAYLFRHAILREVAYESVLLRERPHYHKQAAEWLNNQSSARVGEFAGLIAEHYERAGEPQLAAEKYVAAAKRAAETADPQLAITYYRKVLSLSPRQVHQLDWYRGIYEALGRLLYGQAFLIEATQVIIQMVDTARLVGDLNAQARAALLLADLSGQQNDASAMVNYAHEAEVMALLVGDVSTGAMALWQQSMGHFYLGEADVALDFAADALAAARQVLASNMICKALAQLSRIHLGNGRREKADRYLAQCAGELLRLKKEAPATRLIAECDLILAALCLDFDDYEQAASAIQSALQIYRKLDDAAGLAKALRLYGKMLLASGDVATAVATLQEAISTAETIGNIYDALFSRLHLNQALLAANQPAEAQSVLEDVLSITQDSTRMKGWIGLIDFHH